MYPIVFCIKILENTDLFPLLQKSSVIFIHSFIRIDHGGSQNCERRRWISIVFIHIFQIFHLIMPAVRILKIQIPYLSNVVLKLFFFPGFFKIPVSVYTSAGDTEQFFGCQRRHLKFSGQFLTSEQIHHLSAGKINEKSRCMMIPGIHTDSKE